MEGDIHTEDTIGYRENLDAAKNEHPQMREGLHTADPPGGLQKQSRARRGRHSSADSTETKQHNSINYTTYRVTVSYTLYKLNVQIN